MSGISLRTSLMQPQPGRYEQMSLSLHLAAHAPAHPHAAPLAHSSQKSAHGGRGPFFGPSFISSGVSSRSGGAMRAPRRGSPRRISRSWMFFWSFRISLEEEG